MAEIDRTEEFKAWVAKQDPAESYPNSHLQKCALARFGLGGVMGSNCAAYGIPLKVYYATIREQPFTFGALAERLAKITARSGA